MAKWQQAALALAALANLLATGNVVAKRESERYLRIPTGVELETAEMRELKAILTHASAPDGGEPLVMLSELEGALASDRRELAAGLKRATYAHLVELADSASASCPAPMLRTCINIVGLQYAAFEEPRALQKLTGFVNFIKRLGAPHLAACLARLSEQLARTLPLDSVRGVERAFDRLLAAAFHSDAAAAPAAAEGDDESLYASARALSLAYDEFDARRLLQAAAAESAAGGAAAADFTAMNPLIHLEALCKRLRQTEQLGALFDLVNVARALERPGAEARAALGTSLKFYKLNEYNRLCVELESAKTRGRVEANIAELLAGGGGGGEQ